MKSSVSQSTAFLLGSLNKITCVVKETAPDKGTEILPLEPKSPLGFHEHSTTPAAPSSQNKVRKGGKKPASSRSLGSSVQGLKGPVSEEFFHFLGDGQCQDLVSCEEGAESLAT